jgi:hypothetical protein
MTSKVGLGEMFEGDSEDMCAEKFLVVSMGGRAEGLACTDPGAMTPILLNLIISFRISYNVLLNFSSNRC